MGGAQAVLYSLVCALKIEGHEQTIIYVHDGPYRTRFEDMNIPLMKISGIISWFDPIALFRLYKAIHSFRPDCIHTVLWAANFMGRCIARLLHIPCVVSFHNNQSIQGPIRTALDRCISYDGIYAIAVSSEVRDSFSTVIPREWIVIQNGIDVASIQHKSAYSRKTREDLDLDSSHFVIGSVGRFHPVKRWPYLFDAFNSFYVKNPQARLIIIGSGGLENELRAYAQKIGISEAVRWIVGKTALDYYHLFDCFSLASEREGISIALLEAMCLAIVPIVTHVSVQHPVIEHGVTGYVANCHDGGDIATQWQLIKDDISLKVCLAKNAQRFAMTRYGATAMIAAYKGVFQKMIAEKK